MKAIAWRLLLFVVQMLVIVPCFVQWWMPAIRGLLLLWVPAVLVSQFVGRLLVETQPERNEFPKGVYDR